MAIETSKLIVGIILIILGVVFFFNNKNIGKGAFKFYRALYTEKNLIIMFKALGIVLFVGGILLIILK